ncbi:uncharacterized protein K489DRAFT_223231 [Dissoconium aciculare CBS 342.82]|uniref:Uncharacterized protein n=1 Tax=Dissoconium aciculare CBS 342.82 TaxID=1314786 RepID=A0A6J3M4Q8_9PEZI|nr:uncharacterized protein K489DRAFT_223231 [Dissoconium aciculare CBS 342.82]KAF1823016.1 hypothetical protein K489DRAFT_223231 [Dissoconium aciculare CBS 342.82]
MCGQIDHKTYIDLYRMPSNSRKFAYKLTWDIPSATEDGRYYTPQSNDDSICLYRLFRCRVVVVPTRRRKARFVKCRYVLPEPSPASHQASIIIVDDRHGDNVVIYHLWDCHWRTVMSELRSIVSRMWVRLKRLSYCLMVLFKAGDPFLRLEPPTIDPPAAGGGAELAGVKIENPLPKSVSSAWIGQPKNATSEA